MSIRYNDNIISGLPEVVNAPNASSDKPISAAGVANAIVGVETDLAGIHATGTTNATGSTITSGTYFYLNGSLVQATADIASGATFTSGTNYSSVTAGGLNALKSAIEQVIYGTPIVNENISISASGTFTWDLPAGSYTPPSGYDQAGFLIYTNTYRFYVNGWGGDRIYYTVVNTSSTVKGTIKVIPIFEKLPRT